MRPPLLHSSLTSSRLAPCLPRLVQNIELHNERPVKHILALQMCCAARWVPRRDVPRLPSTRCFGLKVKVHVHSCVAYEACVCAFNIAPLRQGCALHAFSILFSTIFLPILVWAGRCWWYLWAYIQRIRRLLRLSKHLHRSQRV